MVNFMFCVDSYTGEIDRVYGFSPFGITFRHQGDWGSTRWEISGLDEKANHRLYLLDWDKVEMPDVDVDKFDPEVLQSYDKGELTEATLRENATLAFDGSHGDSNQEKLMKFLEPFNVKSFRDVLSEAYDWPPDATETGDYPEEKLK
jgi:hypothetical protein